jgi:hypothetical protein
MNLCVAIGSCWLMAKESALPDRQAREGSGSGFRVSSFEFRVLAALVSKV